MLVFIMTIVLHAILMDNFWLHLAINNNYDI